MKSLYATLTLAILAGFSSHSQALETDSVYGYNGGNNPAFNAISSVDLLEAGSPTFLSLTATKDASTNIVSTYNSGLNDGLSLTSSFANSAYYGYNDASNDPTGLGSAKANLIVGNQLGGSGVTVTFNLNTSVNTLGYTINTVNTIAGWQDHASVANQDYSLSYATVAAPTVFIPVTSVAYNPNLDPAQDDNGGGGVATEVGLTNLNLLGVSSLQFTFTHDPASLGFGNTATGSWYQEVDAFGTPTAAPEPGTWAMLGLGAAALLFVTRVRRLNA